MSDVSIAQGSARLFETAPAVPVKTRTAAKTRAPRKTGGKLGTPLKKTALAAVIPVSIVLAWYLLTSVFGVFAPYQLPSPGSVWNAAFDMSARATGVSLLGHVGISTQRVLLGFGLGAVAGLLVGALVGLLAKADSLLSGTIGAFRAVPSLGWVPLLILWVGINEESKVLLIAIGAFFPAYTTVATALRHVDAHLVEMGRAYGLHGVALLRQIQLPAAMPNVIAGLRLALAQAWLFLVAAELIASSKGLGFLLIDSANNGRVDRILLSLVVLAVLGKLSDSLVGVFERHVNKRW